MRQPPFAALRFWVFALAAAWLASGAPAPAQSVRARNEDGLKAYQAKRYGEAAEDFQKAAEIAPDNPVLDYNAGAALAAESKLDEAQAPLAKAAEARDGALAARAAYSRGSVAYELARQQAAKGDTQKALPAVTEAAKDALQALRANPSDGDARYNYELATRLQQELRQQQQQQQQQQQKKDDQKKDDKQDQKDQQQQKDQQKKDDQQKDQQNKDDQQKQEDQQKQNDQQKQQQQDQQSQQSQQGQPKQDEQKQKDEQQKDADQQKPDEDQQKANAAASQGDQNDASLNVLNLIDNNDTKALKQMLRRQAGHVPQPAQDW